MSLTHNPFFLPFCRYRIMTVRTCRKNRKGWPKDIMDLNNKAGRGTLKMAHCPERNLAAFQWCDSKVVNCVSSYLNFGVSNVERQIGSNKRTFPCPSLLVHYQENMGGVDKADQIRSHFGGFTSQSHFKKWYKKAVMDVLDCMLINAMQLWNMYVTKFQGDKNCCDTNSFLSYLKNCSITKHSWCRLHRHQFDLERMCKHRMMRRPKHSMI
jgi:Transposase IS4